MPGRGPEHQPPAHSGAEHPHQSPVPRNPGALPPPNPSGHQPSGHGKDAQHPDDKDGKNGDEKPKKGKHKLEESPEERAAKRRAMRERSDQVASEPYSGDRAKGSTPYEQRQPGDGTHEHYTMQSDGSQSTLRRTNDVRQVNLEPVIDHLNHWAKPADGDHPKPPLLHAIDESAKGPITKERLAEILPGFGSMKQSEQLATVGAIARMSHQFHDAHAVENSGGSYLHSRHDPKSGDPVDPAPQARAYGVRQNVTGHGDEPNSAALGKEQRKFNALWRNVVGKPSKSDDPDVQASAARLRPDFSGKNYAVLEVQKTNHDGSTETHYVIDSSVPANNFDKAPDHSEPVLGEAFRKMDAENPGVYKSIAMYTEYEPCGSKTDPASANCSYYLSHEFERPAGADRTQYHDVPHDQRDNLPNRTNSTTVYYAAGYRYGDLSPHEVERIRDSVGEENTEKAIKEAKQQAKMRREEDMHRARGEMLRIWMQVASS